MKKNEMGGECSTYGGKKSFVQRFCCGNLRLRENLEEQRFDGRITLKCLVKK